MRDKKFVAIHRGGELSLENHRKLMAWAISCFERVLIYYNKELDEPIIYAIKIARDWIEGKSSTGVAIKASRDVHSFAKTIDNPVAYAVARAVGHGVATAHMADHCMGAALYAQKALKLAGKSFEDERNWQLKKLEDLDLADDLVKLIKATIAKKAKGLGL